MNSLPKISGWLLLLLLGAAILAPAPAMAQRRTRPAGVKSLPKIKLESERSPDFKDAKKGNAALAYWGVISLEQLELDLGKFEFVDELEVYVLALLDRKPRSAQVFEQSFLFKDVEGGTKHNAKFYLPPTFFRKHLESTRVDVNKVSVYVELRIDKKPIHREVIVNTQTGMPKDWFQQLRGATPVKDEILPKSKTPFASLDYDFYMYEKPTP